MSYALNSLKKGMPRHRRSRSAPVLLTSTGVFIIVGYFDGLKVSILSLVFKTRPATVS